MTPSRNVSQMCSERIHGDTVLCSNFRKIVRCKVGEAMHCFGDKKLALFRRHFRPVFRRASIVLQESVPRNPTPQCKISSRSVRFCRSYFRKVISYERNVCLWRHNDRRDDCRCVKRAKKFFICEGMRACSTRSMAAPCTTELDLTLQAVCDQR